ncbi:MAG: LamG domain-containing protein [Myxococcales bacterium]|nr:LamG domain-containing protein [Myxococcales bacterium]
MGFIYYAGPAGVAAEVDPLALKVAQDLADLNSAATARDNLGLGDLATVDRADLREVSAAGSDGQVLTAQGAGIYGWEDAPEAGGAVNLGSHAFNGSSAYMGISAASAPNLSLTGSFTIEAWVYIGNAVGDSTISSRWGASDTSKNHWFRHDGSGRLELVLWDSAGPFLVLWQSDLLRLETDTWQHVAVSFDVSTDTAIFYLNGVAVTTDTAAIDTIQAGDADFRLGARADNASYFAGNLNTVRIWDDVRSAAEINANMYAILGIATPNLIAEWTLHTDGTDSISGYNLATSGAVPVSFVPWRI